MLFALAYSLLRLLLDLADVRLRVRDPEAELLLLRHQLRVVRRQVKRPQLNTADRTIMAALSQRMNRAALAGMLVQPQTVLGWHRELVRRRWAACGPRRGVLLAAVRQLNFGTSSGAGRRLGIIPKPKCAASCWQLAGS